MMNRQNNRVAVIGAGPAGLTAAYLLSKNGLPVDVFEADPEYVGGISRTVNYKGFHFDIGGHRFFSKSKDVEDFWSEILGPDLLDRPRSSRIFYRGKFFSYPLKAIEVLFKLGPVECTLCVLSYLRARLMPIADPRSFEDWVTNQFGTRLFRIFFKTYTEKVWGMSCREISADWAAQRIQGLSLWAAMKSAVFPGRKKASNHSEVIKTLIDSFRYPRKGPGMLWEACAEKAAGLGASIHMGQSVVECVRDAALGTWTVVSQDNRGERHRFQADHVVCSAPIRELAGFLRPEPSRQVLDAASRLRYRDFLTVALILKDRRLFSDNWVYIHDPGVKVGRIQNYKSWSPEMVPDPENCCYGLEYFCFEGDALWCSSDADLIELAKRELTQIGLGSADEVLDGCVVRQRKAYPIYDGQYAEHVSAIRDSLGRDYPNLHLVGRNGMHKYNNQDHAMMTAMLTVKNILAGAPLYNVWNVNQDAEYHECGNAGAGG